ncbi:MAG: Nucleoid occlusion protein [Candidatus Methanofastidiosum methylothiophilum]|uniref:Nucleoid occlusion protein n=1 Tax=Candidatus Methanofastidiosum methylothiophilum TaxID=1705564 RepID=A0A150IHI6_9EURY|nr:MAG: Nucleoid occlusion protein [Candidatus Methanofastidiosum methylthiophilus]
MKGMGILSTSYLLGIKGEYKLIRVSDLLKSPLNIRQRLESKDLQELLEDIKANGLTYPLIVHKKNKSYYEIIDGHRRLMVAKMLGWETVMCWVSDYTLSTEQILTIMRSSEIKKAWTEYDLAKYYSMVFANSDSMTSAAEKVHKSVQKFREYCAVGDLPEKTLSVAINHGVPFNYTVFLADKVASNALCKHISCKKEEIVDALLRKIIAKKITSMTDFRVCVKSFPFIKADDLKFWIFSDQDLLVLQAMTDNLTGQENKKVKSIIHSIAMTEHIYRESSNISIDGINRIREQLNAFLKVLKRDANKLNSRARKEEKDLKTS